MVGASEGSEYKITLSYAALCRQLKVSFQGDVPAYLNEFQFYPYEIADAIPDCSQLDDVPMILKIVSINHDKTYWDAALDSVIALRKRVRKAVEPETHDFAEIFAQIQPRKGEPGPTFDLRLKVQHVPNSIVPGDRSFRLELEAISVVNEINPAVEVLDDELPALKV